MTEHKAILTNPSATVITWNYVDRITASGGKDVHDIEDRVIINSASLKSISTSKSKSSPAGSFEIRLAPTFNWVTRLTPGSWCVILMSPQNDIPQITNRDPGLVDPKTFKMLGRINSVRAIINIDQTTGTRMTEYLVSGEDWASVFNTSLYVDPIAKNNALDSLSAPGHAAFLLSSSLADYFKKEKGLPTSSTVCQDLISLWGDPLALIEGKLSNVQNIQLSSDNQFLLPIAVRNYMGFKTKVTKSNSINLASLITLVDGVLTGPDRYSGDIKQEYGIINPNSLYGQRTFWQVLMDNANTPLNELIADIRFENNSPILALYRRIKPFITRDKFDQDDNNNIKDLISPFKYIKKASIPDEEIISINAGTNWKDKINFVEVRSKPLQAQGTFDIATKIRSQAKDLKAFERDGFKPLFETVKYFPLDASGAAQEPLYAADWNIIMREWYFNTHNMLNGAVSFIGRQEYIQVGDNIEIPTRVFGAPFNAKQAKLEERGNKTFLLAQVESISHDFTVNDFGARSFATSVQFSRGIIVDENGDTVDNSAGGAVDQDAETLIDTAEKNTKSTFGTSTENDTDVQKLRGR